MFVRYGMCKRGAFVARRSSRDKVWRICDIAAKKQKPSTTLGNAECHWVDASYDFLRQAMTAERCTPQQVSSKVCSWGFY